MRYIVETIVHLNYRAKGFVIFTPADAEALVDLDESFPLVKSGVIVLHDLALTLFECQASEAETVVRASLSVCSEIYGEPADLKRALADGWLAWPSPLEIEESNGKVSTLHLADSRFENKVRDDLTTGGNP